MKKLTKTLAIITAITMFCFFTGCHKMIINKYEGTWDFVTIRSQTDTIYFTGAVRGGMYKDEVEIWYTDYDAPFLKIKSSGELFADRGAYKVGQFEGKNKVHIEIGGDVVDGIRIPKD